MILKSIAFLGAIALKAGMIITVIAIIRDSENKKMRMIDESVCYNLQETL